MRWSLYYLVFSSFLNSLSLSEIPANLDQLVVGIKDNDNFTSILLNFGQKYRHFENIEEMLRNKIDILSKLLKIHIDRLRNHDEQVELVFLVDSSGSVGLENFQSELNFVRKLLADFTVKPTATRVALITFAGKKDITRNIDQISRPGKNDQKCYLLNKQLNKITYSGGGTYTKGALLEALAILENSRKAAKKVVFLITDGYSNGGDPRPVAHLLKSLGTTIFTFGIRTGNVEELHDIASVPGYTHSYLLDSFSEFEALARRALHRDLIAGEYVAVATPSDCNILCSEKSASSNNETCCDALATCTCGTATGHYACLCPAGYFGSGFKGLCQLCPNGTYGSGDINGDSISTCISCPDVNHITLKIPATSVEDCICASGFTTDGRKCEVITCPKLRVPENGYLVKASACSNVVNAACGVRCKIGFHLTGDSIRLCRKNGSWSGNEPQCLLKTCPALRAPIHGKMRCQHDIDYNHPSVDSTSHPIDTRCQFRCEIGFQLRGSKVRNCLPLSRWDGLKVTCRALKCEPLKQVSNGEILPKNCLGPEKLSFATNCSVTCKDGFTLEGPRARFCGGRTGIWSQRHSVNRCVDKIPPVIKCPSNITLENLKGENFAYINWTVPIAIDNTDDAPTVWSKPHIVFPWKVKIGSRTIIYIAQDSSGNKARCKFKVTIIDKESPVAQDCIDPPIFFTDIQTGVENVIWDEPVFHDNSKIPVKMTQSHIPLKNNFPIGKTKIIYNATDTYGNFAICTLNITVEDICTNFPSPINGQIKCDKNNEKKEKCILTCNEGYGFPIEIPYFEAMDNELLLRCNARNRSWTDFYFPECSEATLPKSISQDGNIFLESNETEYCNNSTNLQELSDNINEDLRLKLIEICRNDIDCNLVSFNPICEVEVDSQHVNNNLIRKRRQFKDKSMKKKVKKDKIEIKFKFIGKIIEENMDNPKVGLQKLREKIESLTRSGKLNLLNNKTNQEIAKLALNLHLVFKDPQKLCEDGSVLKKNSCVKCSRGTFYNNSTGQCQSCPFGQYQNVTGSSKCERCPYNTFTKRMHAKSIEECIRMCQPGFYSRRRRYQNQFFSLEPCSICEIGSYQPNYGQHLCLPCPSNTTTKYHGSTSIYNCMPLTDKRNICDTNPCSNGGSCIKEEDTFSCDCPNNYIGSRCEIFQSPCHSFPCLNGGVCNMKYEFQRSISYSCTCKSGYTGKNCEKYLDECSTNPCQNGGECKSTENDYVCECKEGYEGPFCEILSDHCLRAPCTEGSTCQTINETWHCICKPGFLGRHCNLLPCDWLPCHEKAICINLEEINATRNSYRCECPPGFIGFDCATKIDFCKSEPCKNNGKCVNGIGNYTCECSIPFKGINCETELSSNYVMHFQKSGIADYVMIKGPLDDLSEISTCFWLQSVDTLNYGTILSYATEYNDNAFTITDYNGFVLYVNGDKVVTDIKANDGYWHFLCITWESSNGSWSIFVDGLLKDNGILLSKGKNIRANGSLVIGQEQDRVGGGFSESESFLGKMSLFDIWSTIIDENNITHFLNTCETYYGNLFAWPQMQEFIHGEIMILKSPFCRGCLLPVVPFKGNLNFSENLIEVTYICEDGYVVKYGKEEYKYLKRKCLKYGQWEGREGYTPYCEKIKCGYPGYFPRGRIHGISYNFGDEIQYSCFKGHELKGNPRRICNSSGKWSGSTPICIGITCKNLLAPENGDIEYIIEEYERDDISILQVGHQLEFKCDPGFRLKGEKLLTCMENGVWDHERPECISSGCPPPKEIEHGYIASVTSEAINHTIAFEFKIDPREDKKKKIYFYGDIIGFSCHQGYKFRANHNLLAEFRLQCSNDGTWTGFVPDCVLLYCPWPNPVENGTIFLRLEDNTTIEIPLDDNMTMYEWNIKETENSAEKETTKFLKELFVPGAYISTICHQGFQLIGEKSRICTENEIWSEESPICQIRECPEHPLLKVLSFILEGNQKNKGKHLTGSSGNLTFSSQGNVYGNLIIFNCLHNMKINLNPFVTDLLSNLTWQCDANGIWQILHLELNSTIVEQLLSDSKRETCRNLICPSPKIPEFGFIMPINSNNFKDETSSSGIVTFNCRQGYFLEGNEKSICLLNGTWSSFPTCKSIVCGTPISYPNAEIIGKVIAKNYTFGNIIFYQCIPGYRLFGQAYVRCLSNGKWSKLHSRCAKISCGKPKTIPGVILRGQSYLYQDQLTYTCPNKKEEGSITCKSDGHWTDLISCNNN